MSVDGKAIRQSIVRIPPGPTNRNSHEFLYIRQSVEELRKNFSAEPNSLPGLRIYSANPADKCLNSECSASTLS